MSARYEATYRAHCTRCRTDRQTTKTGWRKSLPSLVRLVCPGCWEGLDLPFASARRCVPVAVEYVAPPRRADYRGLAEYPPLIATLAELRAAPGLALARVKP
jgi:hypothetical protein